MRHLVSHCRRMTQREPEGPRFAIGELADAAGVSRRAVRFYVQRGLLAPPLGVGRGAHYDASHLAQLLEIKRRQEAGVSLDAIADTFALAGPPPPPALPAQEAWLRLALAPGVELHLREGALSDAQLAAVVTNVTAILDPPDPPDPPDHPPGEAP